MVKSATATLTVQAPAVPVEPPAEATDEVRFLFYKLPWADRNELYRAVGVTVVPVVNAMEWVLGYDFLGYTMNWEKSYFSLWYKERGTPAIPVAAILAAVAVILLAIGLIIMAVQWFYHDVRKAQEYKSKEQMLKEGLITNEQFTELVKAEAEEPAPWEWMTKLMEALPWLIGGVLLIYVIGMLPKPRREE